MRVKICGITNSDDLHAACKAGADALGFVFYAPSSRFVSIETAQSLCVQVPPFVQKVGLVVNEPESQILRIVNEVQLDLLQFHGDESAEFCEQFNTPYLKAMRVDSSQTQAALIEQLNEFEAQASGLLKGFLLDTYKAGVPGGTGEQFDWQLFPQGFKTPLILAGGLNAENIQAAIAATAPYAVDVSGGVELGKGKKSAEKMQRFVVNAKHGVAEAANEPAK